MPCHWDTMVYTEKCIVPYVLLLAMVHVCSDAEWKGEHDRSVLKKSSREKSSTMWVQKVVQESKQGVEGGEAKKAAWRGDERKWKQHIG